MRKTGKLKLPPLKGAVKPKGKKPKGKVTGLKRRGSD